MTAPSQYLRDLRESREARRLGVAKKLRETPNATNIELAKVFGVTRDTIAQDRKAIVEQMTQNTLTETEQMRGEMLQRLQHLLDEIELHRKDKKLPVSLIHEMHLVTRSMIELLGVRKPVVEQLEVRKRTLSFTTVIAGRRLDDGTLIPATAPKEFTLESKQLALEAGDHVEP